MEPLDKKYSRFINRATHIKNTIDLAASDEEIYTNHLKEINWMTRRCEELSARGKYTITHQSKKNKKN